MFRFGFLKGLGYFGWFVLFAEFISFAWCFSLHGLRMILLWCVCLVWYVCVYFCDVWVGECVYVFHVVYVLVLRHVEVLSDRGFKMFLFRVMRGMF